jgi:hypothetical protein
MPSKPDCIQGGKTPSAAFGGLLEKAGKPHFFALKKPIFRLIRVGF